MGYAVSKSNSIQFQVGDEKLAFAVAPSDLGYDFGMFKLMGTGDWNCPMFGDENGMIAWNLTNEQVMAHGSVANYLLASFPIMQGKLSRYLGASMPKPDQADKPGCVGYDLAKDVSFDQATLAFTLNKEPPLSHAR